MSTYTYPFLIFISSLVLCIIPRFLTKLKTIKLIYPYITSFSAGFMLAVMLVDFVPHLINNDHDHKTRKCPLHNHNEYYSCKKSHTAEEEAKLAELEKNHSESHSHDDHYDCKNHKEHENHDSNTKKKKRKNCSHFNYGLFTAGIAFIFLIAIDTLVLHHSHCSKDGLEHELSHEHNHSHSHDHSHDKENFGTCNTSALKYTTSITQAIILILALSIHSFFEGLAFSEEYDINTFEIGILIHKILESFTLGVTMASSKFNPLSIFLLSTVYSALTPLGMLVSFKLIKFNRLKEICNGLALGSTLFIVCIEMIPPIFHAQGKPSQNLMKIGCLSCGFLITSAIVKVFH
ncbi:hypothetical protein GVAV_001881 [Gurleya vavrai]